MYNFNTQGDTRSQQYLKPEWPFTSSIHSNMNSMFNNSDYPNVTNANPGSNTQSTGLFLDQNNFLGRPSANDVPFNAEISAPMLRTCTNCGYIQPPPTDANSRQLATATRLAQLEVALSQTQARISNTAAETQAKLAEITLQMEMNQADKDQVAVAINQIKSGLDKFFTRFAKQLKEGSDDSGQESPQVADSYDPSHITSHDHEKYSIFGSPETQD